MHREEKGRMKTKQNERGIEIVVIKTKGRKKQ